MTDYSLRDLRCLDALLTERHVSRAALRLGMSQPAMSMALARLRRTFGDPLLERRGNRLVPSEGAEALAPRIRRLIREMEDLAAGAGRFDPATSGRSFCLMLTDYIDAILMPALHRRLAHTAPGVSLRIIGPQPPLLGSLLGDGTADLTVTYFPAAPGSLLSRAMFTDRLVCLLRPGHPALAAPLTPEAFCALPHVAVEPAEATMYRAPLDTALADRGLTRRIAHSRPDFLGLPAILAESDLVATLPGRLADLFAARHGLRVLPPPLDLPPLDIRMLWHRTTQTSPAHRWLRGEVAAALATRSTPDPAPVTSPSPRPATSPP